MEDNPSLFARNVYRPKNGAHLHHETLCNRVFGQNLSIDAGGDGVDLSGSRVSINGTLFQGISDKALSVGERSKVSATHLSIGEVAIGAASKDGSHLAISDSTITRVKNSGLMAYIKKPEYGPATIEASNIKFSDTPVKTRVQRGSSITLEGEKMEPEDMDVKQLYKTNVKPR